MGAFFEICALGMMIHKGQTVLPAPSNCPGYDGTVSFESGEKINISVKNYGLFSHYCDFLASSERIEKKVKEILIVKKVLEFR